MKALLARSLLLACHRAATALTGTRVCLGTLTADGKSSAVAQPTVATDIHQPLNVELDLRPKSAFYGVVVFDQVADFARVILRPLLRSDILVDPRTLEYFDCRGS